MKKNTIALLALVTLSALAPAQNALQDLFNKENLPGLIVKTAGVIATSQQSRQERIKIGKENLQINADLPAVSLRGQRILFRIDDDTGNTWSRRTDPRTLLELAHTANALGATVAFDEDQLDDIEGYFDRINDSKYVDPATKFQTADLKAATVQVDVSVRLIESSSDLEGFLGKFYRGIGLDLERSTSYVGIAFGIRPLKGEHAGNIIATYLIVGRSSTTDHLEVSFYESLFGGRQGFSNTTSEKEKRRVNAKTDAGKQLRGVLSEKAKAAESNG